MKTLSSVLPVLSLSLALLSMPIDVAAEEAADAFTCDACHITKNRDFKGRRANPIVPAEEFPVLPTGKQDVASSPAMCLSCHDGFVMDSRSNWTDGEFHGHRLGMQPSSDIHVPDLGGETAFPMNEDGNMYCGTCHSAHNSDAADAPSRIRSFLRVDANGNLCIGCHADNARIAGSAHDMGRRRMADFEPRGICGSCHAPHTSDRPVMWAREFGHAELTLDRMCRSCHDDAPVPAAHPATVVGWSQDVRGAIFQNTPGEMPVFDADARQQRVGNIGCPTCHNVHVETAEGRPAHLKGLHLRLPEFVEPLCADCHGPESLFLYKFFHSEVSRGR